MNLNIRLFATLKELAGASSVQIELEEPSTVADLLKMIGIKYPNMELSLQSTLVSVNHEYAERELMLKSNNEIALFPPVSGG
jgi:molybdopterin synthase catalytic subunit